jgi:hypothetical protein
MGVLLGVVRDAADDAAPPASFSFDEHSNVLNSKLTVVFGLVDHRCATRGSAWYELSSRQVKAERITIQSPYSILATNRQSRAQKRDMQSGFFLVILRGRTTARGDYNCRFRVFSRGRVAQGVRESAIAGTPHGLSLQDKWWRKNSYKKRWG